MIKALFVLLPLAGISAHAQAAHCPSASELTHVKNQKWAMPASFHQEGWRISSTRPADLGNWGQMPQEAKLAIWLYPQNRHPLKASCIYDLGYQAAVMVTKEGGGFDPKTIPMPPFNKSLVQGTDGYSCFISAGAAEDCHW